MYTRYKYVHIELLPWKIYYMVVYVDTQQHTEFIKDINTIEYTR